MTKYTVSFTLNGGTCIAFPINGFSGATELAKVLLKNKLTSVVTIANTKTGGTTDFVSADVLEK